MEELDEPIFNITELLRNNKKSQMRILDIPQLIKI